MKMVLNETTKNYMLKIYAQYQAKKLTYREEVQMYQDLYDSGLFLQMGDLVKEYVQRLITVGLIKKENQSLN